MAGNNAGKLELMEYQHFHLVAQKTKRAINKDIVVQELKVIGFHFVI